MRCRLDRRSNGQLAVVAPNVTVFEQILPHADFIGPSLREICGTDETVNITHVRQPAHSPIFAKPPKDDEQLDMFVPEISELAIKDDVHLMAVAPWTNAPGYDRNPARRRTEINYQANGMAIRIKGSEEYGLPTHLDYDIVILMQSWLVQQANIYRQQLKDYHARVKRGQHVEPPALPPHSLIVHKKQILAFARQAKGGKQYERIEEMLARLKETNIYIEQKGKKRRRKGSFSLIADWRTVSKTDTGEVLSVRIDIPNWIYEGIVENPTPTVLTYNRDYFLLKKPNARLVYRLAKLHAKLGEVVFDLSEIHHRSGSRTALKEFNREFVHMLQQLNKEDFPDYDLELSEGKRNRTLTIRAKSEENADG